MRQKLPNRRAAETFDIEANGLRYRVTAGYFPDGRLAEIFINNAKQGSHSDTAARDSAVVASLALQHGVPLDVIRRALMRDAQGRASGPLGVALDLLANELTINKGDFR
jgi:ribonucleoside-diphosphate reductase alpha chain